MRCGPCNEKPDFFLWMIGGIFQRLTSLLTILQKEVRDAYGMFHVKSRFGGEGWRTLVLICFGPDTVPVGGKQRGNSFFQVRPSLEKPRHRQMPQTVKGERT